MLTFIEDVDGIEEIEIDLVSQLILITHITHTHEHVFLMNLIHRVTLLGTRNIKFR